MSGNAIARLVPLDSTVDGVIAVLAEAHELERENWNREKRLLACAALVFAYWAKRLGHPRALLDRKREARLLQRLRENDGDASELLYVVDGARKDDVVMGRHDERRRYDGISTIFRDREQVERLADLNPGYREGHPHPLAVKYGLTLPRLL